MVVLTNCLARYDDEGSLKLARNLVLGLKKKSPDTTVVTYENSSLLADRHLKLNKLMLSPKLARLLRKLNEDVLCIPRPGRAIPAAMRALILSLCTRRRVTLCMTMYIQPCRIANLLFRLSRVHFVTFSDATYTCLNKSFPGKVHRLKAGVDTERFVPLPVDKKKQFCNKYGLPVDKPIVLHVGHMKYGRNVDKMLAIDDRFHAVLAVSTHTAAFKDRELEEKLRAKTNLTIIDTYVPQIEELYQLADVYFFPVIEKNNCIDAPLSALEAASCNVPVLATPYGALEPLLGSDGFYPIESFAPDKLNQALQTAVTQPSMPRTQVLPYDWETAVDDLLKRIQPEA